MTLAAYAILALGTAVGAFVQGTIGVGFALIVAPLAILVAPDLVPVTVLGLMLPLNLYVIARERGSIDRRGAAWVTLGRLGGTVGGLAVVALLSLPQLRIAIGLATLAAALASMLAPAFAPRPGAFALAGLVTGITETATGVGGPPMALVFQHAPPPTLRTTIAACFLVGQILSLAALLATGRVATSQLTAGLLLLPPLALGALASRLAHGALDGRRLRAAVLAFAVVSGFALML